MGDSAVVGASDSHGIFSTATPKVRRVGAYLLGASGDGYWFALLQAVRWPTVAAAGYADGGGLQADILKTKHELGFAELKGEGDLDGSLLLGAVIDGLPRLWYAEHTGMVDALPDGPFAIGSGGEACLAALLAMRPTNPEQAATRALEIAESLRADVRGPFTKAWL
jgi:hypothetical protein